MNTSEMLAMASTEISNIRRELAEKDVLIERLRDALESASDHLDYCGYGDSWERECAREAKLEEKIRDALAEAEKEMEKRKPAGKNKK